MSKKLHFLLLSVFLCTVLLSFVFELTSAAPGHKDDDEDDYWNYAVNGYKDPPKFDKRARKSCKPDYECCLGRNCKTGYYCVGTECKRNFPILNNHHELVS
jgi:hypothetical protein